MYRGHAADGNLGNCGIHAASRRFAPRRPASPRSLTLLPTLHEDVPAGSGAPGRPLCSRSCRLRNRAPVRKSRARKPRLRRSHGLPGAVRATVPAAPRRRKREPLSFAHHFRPRQRPQAQAPSMLTTTSAMALLNSATRRSSPSSPRFCAFRFVRRALVTGSGGASERVIER